MSRPRKPSNLVRLPVGNPEVQRAMVELCEDVLQRVKDGHFANIAFSAELLESREVVTGSAGLFKHATIGRLFTQLTRLSLDLVKTENS